MIYILSANALNNEITSLLGLIDLFQTVGKKFFFCFRSLFFFVETKRFHRNGHFGENEVLLMLQEVKPGEILPTASEALCLHS